MVPNLFANLCSLAGSFLLDEVLFAFGQNSEGHECARHRVDAKAYQITYGNPDIIFAACRTNALPISTQVSAAVFDGWLHGDLDAIAAANGTLSDSNMQNFLSSKTKIC